MEDGKLNPSSVVSAVTLEKTPVSQATHEAKTHEAEYDRLICLPRPSILNVPIRARFSQKHKL